MSENIFEPDERITQKVDALWALSLKRNRNDFLTFAEMEETASERRYYGSWGHVFQKFERRLLNERGIKLINLRGVGYRLASAKDQVHIAATKHTRRAMRQHGKAHVTLVAVSLHELTVHDQAVRASKMAAARTSYLRSRNDLRSTKALLENGVGQSRKSLQRQKHKAALHSGGAASNA